MPLLIIPLVFLVALAAWVILLPYLTWRQYRLGREPRRAVPWLMTFQAWSLLVSTLMFVTCMALATVWWPQSLNGALLGLGGGVVLGLVGARLCQSERSNGQISLIPNPWPVTLVYLLVACRLLLGVADLWRRVIGGDVLNSLPTFNRAGLQAVAGVVLGYYLALAWGLRWRLDRLLRHPRPST